MVFFLVTQYAPKRHEVVPEAECATLSIKSVGRLPQGIVTCTALTNAPLSFHGNVLQVRGWKSWQHQRIGVFTRVLGQLFCVGSGNTKSGEVTDGPKPLEAKIDKNARQSPKTSSQSMREKSFTHSTRGCRKSWCPSSPSRPLHRS